jgi:hypothetical protein
MAWKPRPRGTVQVRTSKGFRAARILNVDSATQLDLLRYHPKVALNNSVKDTKVGRTVNTWRPA